MALPLYLAMTAAELHGCASLPPKLGYMACHFSPYDAGLSNCPARLPADAMVILDDSVPLSGHDPRFVAEQLTQIVQSLRAECVLLDFQRPDNPSAAELAEIVVGVLPCPVGVSEKYVPSHAPVFLPPPPPDVTPEAYLAPWAGREIWLEASLEGQCVRVTEKGAVYSPLSSPPEGTGLADETLCCHYQIRTAPDCARFFLYRTEQDLSALLDKAAALGVTRAVGLYQELHGKLPAVSAEIG